MTDKIRNVSIGTVIAVIVALGGVGGVWVSITTDVESNTKSIEAVDKKVDTHIEEKDEYVRKDVFEERYKSMMEILIRLENKVDKLGG